MNTKQLKQKILSLAITGRLVPQDPRDESASELIYRINSKATIVQGDAPFDIPNNWVWCRLGSVCDIARGGSPRPIKKYLTDAENGVNWIKIGDTKPDDKYVRSVKQKIKPEGVSRSRFVHKGDFLLTNSMSFGRPYILDVDGCIHDGWLVISPKGGVYNKDFLYYLLSSPFAYEQFSREAGGGVVDNLNSEKVSNTIFPLPSLAEQKRIAEAVERWFAKIDQLEHDCEALSKFGKQVRKKLLSAAIAGRLVPQDPSDEPASELLKKIREEKAQLVKEGKLKKDKNETLIFRGDDKKFYEQKGKNVTCIDDQIPFEIPDSWEWCRMGDIFSHCSGKALNQSNNKGTLRPYITTSNLYWNNFVLDNLRQMPFTKEELDKCTAVKGDLLVCEGGDVGRAAIWNYDEPICLQNHIHKLRAYVPLCTLFFYNVLYLYKHTGRIGGKGIALLGLSSRALHNIIIPLPPLAEQKRIVEKLESMFAMLDKLDALTA